MVGFVFSFLIFFGVCLKANFFCVFEGKVGEEEEEEEGETGSFFFFSGWFHISV